MLLNESIAKAFSVIENVEFTTTQKDVPIHYFLYIYNIVIL